MLTFKSPRTVAIGEAMIEMAVIGDDTYRRSYAGDTFNTAWHMSQLAKRDGTVGFVTKVGQDSASNGFVAQLAADGLDTSCIGQMSDRTMGLYMIELQDTERHFHYWRSHSAARLLADDPDWLVEAIDDAGLIHLSGITLAILSDEARVHLWQVLSAARAKGARVSFDPNVRPKLWTWPEETKTTLSRFFQITDIILPSFDDEAALWGDAAPQMTVERFSKAGVSEIVVKNGAGPVRALSADGEVLVDTPSVSGIRDTSGAGDAFNAGYLAARLNGAHQSDAIRAAQQMSSEVIRHFGARIPKTNIPYLA
ncbi:sugar kinase [Yoonia sp.]|nr:sugar kinase [Yoonia sp.]